MHDGGCLPHAGRAAAVGLRGAGEPDILRRGEPRAARSQAEGDKPKAKPVKCKKGFVKKKGKCVKKTSEEGQEVRPRQQEER